MQTAIQKDSNRQDTDRMEKASFCVADDRIVQVSSGLLTLYGVGSMDELVRRYGPQAEDLVSADDRDDVRLSCQLRQQYLEERKDLPPEEAVRLGEMMRVHFHIQRTDGRRLEVYDHLLSCHKKEQGYEAEIELIPAVLPYNGLFDIDRITSLMRMHSFLDAVEERKQRKPEQGCYLYFNIAHFKRYNMTHGLAEGDRFLRATADILKDCFPGALIARFAADHFSVYTQNPHYLQGIMSAHEKVGMIRPEATAELKAGVYLEDVQKHTAVNAACDFAKTACDSIADKANTYYRIYDAETAAEIERRSYIAENIDTAIHRGWIHVYYQPVVRTISHTLCSFEALTRWLDPRYGFLSPGVFIPVLEENRQIYKLDLYVLEQVCRRIKQQMEDGSRAVPVSFNLSRIDFVMVDVFTEVEKMVRKYQIPRDMIRLEVTESAIMQDKKRMAETIARFRKAGYQVWMDDFGSGYSSLNMLKDFHFDEIKLDMEFLRSFSEASRKIVRSTVQMAKSLHIHTLAEGVETPEQVKFLQEIGCEKMQGFYFGKPAPFEESIAHCENDKKLTAETREENSFLERIGQVNMQTEQAMVLADYLGSGNYHLFFVNQPCEKIFQELGYASLEEFLKITRSEQSLSYFRISDYLDSVAESEADSFSHPFYLTVSGHYLCARIHMLAHEKGHTALQVFIYDLTREEGKELGTKIDSVLRNVLVFYDNIFLMHFPEDYYEVIYQGPYFDGISGVKYNHLEEQSERFAKQYVYPSDRKRFAAFIKPSTLADRINASSSHCVMGQFRLRAAHGTYSWKLCSVFLLPESNGTIGVMCIRNSILDSDPDQDVQVFARSYDGEALTALARQFARRNPACKEEDPAVLKQQFGGYALSLWKTLMEQMPLRLVSQGYGPPLCQRQPGGAG